MADDEKDKSEKTEEPTQKRLDDAVKRGQVVMSREVYSFFILLAFAMFLLIFLPFLAGDVKLRLEDYILRPEDIRLDTSSFRNEISDLMADLFLMMVAPISVVIACIFAAKFVQSPFTIATEGMIPKLEKISPKKGAGRLLGRKNFVDFLKDVVKLLVVGVVAVSAVLPFKEELRLMVTGDIFGIIDFLLAIVARLMIAMCCIQLIIALIDFIYQKFEYIQNLKMTKQEIKDEYKQQEGDPMVKQKLRAIRRERVRNRMMEAVPESDVVITNPSHYSVALKYDSKTMNAPIVVAKGIDKVALKIREVAEQNDIMIMRNPPLTRLLYDHAQVDEEIPLEYYKAVAQVIGYVYRMKGMELGDVQPGMG